MSQPKRNLIVSFLIIVIAASSYSVTNGLNSMWANSGNEIYCCGQSGSTPTSFTIGQNVITTQQVSVYQNAQNLRVLGSQPQGTIGTISSGAQVKKRHHVLRCHILKLSLRKCRCAIFGSICCITNDLCAYGCEIRYGYGHHCWRTY